MPRWQNWVEAVCCQPTADLVVPYPLFMQGSARATVLQKLCTDLNDKRTEKQCKRVSGILRAGYPVTFEIFCVCLPRRSGLQDDTEIFLKKSSIVLFVSVGES